MRIFILLVAVVSFSCGRGSFNAQMAKAPSESSEDGDEISKSKKRGNSADSSSDSDISAACEKDSTTKAVLLTDKVTNQAANQFLHYKISFESCDGRAISVDGKNLLFDIDVVLQIAAIDYELIVDGEVFKSFADPTRGSDLFGRTGPNYAYYQTETVKTGKETTEIEFRMDISNRDMEPIDGGDELHTYFRLGKAKPVEKSVPFIR